jgi:hypothetical protein
MYKEETLFFSQDNIETLAHVIPTMDWIDNMLCSSASNPLNLAVKAALKFAHKLMDKFYSKTDLSNIYCIAMGTLIIHFSYFTLTLHFNQSFIPN